MYRVAHKSGNREKIEYLYYGSAKEAHFFTKDRGMFTLQIHTDMGIENFC